MDVRRETTWTTANQAHFKKRRHFAWELHGTTSLLLHFWLLLSFSKFQKAVLSVKWFPCWGCWRWRAPAVPSSCPWSIASVSRLRCRAIRARELPRCSWDTVVLSELTPMLPMLKVPAMSSTDWDDKWRKIVLVIHCSEIGDEDWWRLQILQDAEEDEGRKRRRKKEDTKIHWEDFRRQKKSDNGSNHVLDSSWRFQTALDSCVTHEGHMDTAWTQMLLQWHSCCTLQLWRCIEVYGKGE